MAKKTHKGKKHTLKRLSLWPLKPEEALEAFMKADPAKIRHKMQAISGMRVKKACFAK